jgi:hypothetical protein
MVEPAIRLPVHRWPGIRLICAAAVSLGCLFVLGDVSELAPREVPLPDTERIPGEAEVLQDQAIRVDDRFGTKATLKLPDGGVLEFRYSPIADSGVDLRKLDQRDTSTRWEQQCPPLGVAHTEYEHDVFVQVEGETLRVISRGSQGTFAERLDLQSGRRLARSVRMDKE